MKIDQTFIKANEFDADIRAFLRDKNAHSMLRFTIDRVDECPICHTVIEPILLSSIFYPDKDNDAKRTGICLYRCNCCFNAFMVQYDLIKSSCAVPLCVAPTTVSSKEFSQQINILSPNFVKIYNQAYKAEQLGLYEICGVGYRRSIEFLIKDYAIHNATDEATKDSIRAASLSVCVRQYIESDKLKVIASRAVWLGNDHAHYNKLFDEYTLDDLKRFICAAVNWIDFMILAEEALSIPPRKQNHKPE